MYSKLLTYFCPALYVYKRAEEGECDKVRGQSSLLWLERDVQVKHGMQMRLEEQSRARLRVPFV